MNQFSFVLIFYYQFRSDFILFFFSLKKLIPNYLYTHLGNNQSFPLPVGLIGKVKCDPDDDIKMLKIAEMYEQMDEFTIAARPWIDTDTTKKPIINYMTQFALYKCMHPKCVFATNRVNFWKSHMHRHIDMNDILIKSKTILSNSDEMKQFRECCYCKQSSKRNYDYVRHIEEEHSRSIFQCMHCFYRTNEIDNIVFHYNEYHSNATKEILLCGENRREFEHRDEDVINQCSNQFIEKIRCGQGNKHKSFLQQKKLF